MKLQTKPPPHLNFHFQNGTIKFGLRTFQIHSNSGGQFDKIDFSSNVEQCLSKSVSIDFMNELDP